ncbi:hypothetical protein [Kitasatospora sp. LaBMicrA B282]|uniref:hypothetical protein n=1 Tax=Kitasatospora sp. LaBMicrA B282 TaxID=3420949 RepID=UPI003D0F96E3
MGYQTTFTGQVAVEPPLNQQEIAYLRKFAATRREDREGGPYVADYIGYAVQGREADRIPEGQPSRWCNWEATDDGAAIEWNGAEKFYNSPEWMTYLIDHFLKPGGAAQGQPGFEHFTFDHTINGVIDAEGEEPGDIWQLLVRDNEVSVDGPDDFAL